MNRLFFAVLTLPFFWACDSTSSASSHSTSAPAEATAIGSGEYRMEPIPETNHQLASRQGSEFIVEQGITDDKGVKNGIWVEYGDEPGHPKKISSYVKGQYNGPYFEFDEMGKMAMYATYKNNKLHGPIIKYANGRVVQESSYVDGQLDGVYKEYNDRGDLQKEIHYKNGKLDGSMRYYDDKGKVVLEYLYKDGKRQ